MNDQLKSSSAQDATCAICGGYGWYMRELPGKRHPNRCPNGCEVPDHAKDCTCLTCMVNGLRDAMHPEADAVDRSRSTPAAGAVE